MREPIAVDGFDDAPVPDAISNPWKAMTSGGSTGRPKLIEANQPGTIDPDAPPLLMMQLDGTHLMPGPLYHNGPFMWTMTALLAGNHVVLGGKFDAETTLALIDTYHPDSMYVVPTMMARISKLPPEVRDRYDVSSLKVIWHLAAPCPPWLKEEWIDWFGADAIWELYAGTEAQAATIINGAEWLRPQGLGRPGEPRAVQDRARRRHRRRSRRGRRGVHAAVGRPERAHVSLRRCEGAPDRRRLGVARRHGHRSTPTATCISPTARPT